MDQNDSPLGPGKVGRYWLDQIRAKGGMAAIWSGWEVIDQERAGPTVAVKVPHRSTLEEGRLLLGFRKEIEVLEKLSHEKHENILQYIADGEQEGTPYLVTELLVGRTLKEQWLDWRAAGLTYNKVLDVVDAIAGAIEHLQEHRLVHMDLCPENVFLTESGKVKLLDFGSTVEVSEDGVTLVDGDILSKWGRIAPEAGLYGKVTKNSDLFALGTILYELLSGTVPFPKTQDLNALSEAERGRYPDATEHNSRLKDFEDLDRILGSMLVRSEMRSDVRAIRSMLSQARVAGGRDSLVFLPDPSLSGAGRTATPGGGSTVEGLKPATDPIGPTQNGGNALPHPQGGNRGLLILVGSLGFLATVVATGVLFWLIGPGCTETCQTYRARIERSVNRNDAEAAFRLVEKLKVDSPSCFETDSNYYTPILENVCAPHFSAEYQEAVTSGNWVVAWTRAGQWIAARGNRSGDYRIYLDLAAKCRTGGERATALKALRLAASSGDATIHQAATQALTTLQN